MEPVFFLPVVVAAAAAAAAGLPGGGTALTVDVLTLDDSGMGIP